MCRLWATSEWLIVLTVRGTQGVMEVREYVLGPLWSAQQAESHTFGLKCAAERDWSLRAP